MKTDQLIQMLSANVEPVDPWRIHRGLALAIAVSVFAALCAALLGLGLRPDIAEATAAISLLLKLAFGASMVALGAAVLARLARPGGEQRIRPAALAAPFAAIMFLGALSLWFAPSSHWEAMIVGDMWFECLLSIPIIAVVPFVLIVWAVRRLAAPTDLMRTGAFVGLLSGGVSAMGYALHCTDDSLPFVALWYGGTIALCTWAGAILGPRLLRW